MSDGSHRLPRRTLLRSYSGLTIPLLMAALVGSACSAGAGGGGGNASTTTITVAAVGNSQMIDLQKLIPDFESSHSGIKVNMVILPENQLRQQVTQDLATHSGRFDLDMIGTYEVPLFAKDGWIVNLDPYVQKTSSYDPGDLIPGVSKALSYNGSLYAVPFYGESSFLMYRKDLLSAVGVTLSQNPTWDEVAAAARKVNNPSKGIAGICLRGLPGWGEQLAPLDTVVNTFGGQWFDLQWNPQLTSPKFEEAVNFYVNLLKSAGEPGAANSGFGECLNAYNGGKVAMWYDATVGASNFTGDAAANSGYALAPMRDKPYSGWLWAWSLGMSSASTKKDATWTFMSWATSKDYMKLVGSRLGWNHVPPGTRTSTYALPQYQQVAGPFAQLTLDSIAHADVNHPTVNPVPYTGIQYVDIPEFQDIGDRVSQQIAAAIAGSSSVSAALQQAQQIVLDDTKNYRH